jgi:hypothetical protein
MGWPFWAIWACVFGVLAFLAVAVAFGHDWGWEFMYATCNGKPCP